MKLTNYLACLAVLAFSPSSTQAKIIRHRRRHGAPMGNPWYFLSGEKVHLLKTDPEFYAPQFNGIKHFELRRNDRNYKAGDYLVLRETKHTARAMDRGAPVTYTGRNVLVFVSYVYQLPGPDGALHKDWAILSTELVAVNV